jgi:fatty acid/phospholipid biosynthesis enzyme
MAYFFDQAGTTNTFIGTASYSSMAGTGYSNVANGFTTVLAVGAAGSTDTAYLYDAAGLNSFYASAAGGILSTPTNSVSVLNIDNVLVFNQDGSYDQKGLLNPSFNTQFIGTWN